MSEAKSRRRRSGTPTAPLEAVRGDGARPVVVVNSLDAGALRRLARALVGDLRLRLVRDARDLTFALRAESTRAVLLDGAAPRVGLAESTRLLAELPPGRPPVLVLGGAAEHREALARRLDPPPTFVSDGEPPEVLADRLRELCAER